METILTYNVKVACNIKTSGIKKQINNTEINNRKNTTKIYMPSPKSFVLNRT